MPAHSLLVTDFDGTMTDVEFYQLALERYTPSETQYVWERYLRKELTVFETLQGIFSAIKASPAELTAALDDLKFDPGAAAAIGRLREAGWDVVVASAGCAWYIERVLKKAGIEATVHASPGEFAESGGLEMRVASASPYLSASAGIDKAAIVREARENYQAVAFAGDSPNDLEAARLVDDDLRFAKSMLAERLEREGKAFHPYGRWSEIANALMARPA